MNKQNHHVRASALVMRLVGWGVIVSVPQFYDALTPEVTASELDPHYQRIERAQRIVTDAA